LNRHLGLIMLKLNISPAVLDDLQEIKLYISRELNNEQAAVKLISQITNKIRNLHSFPYKGSPISSIMDMRTDYRFLPCASYLIFYRVDHDVIFVSRVLYAKRDYIKILLGNVSEEEQ